MIDYKSLSGIAIADKLGLKKAGNGNYHCFNSAGHKRNDRKASLSISGNGKGFICFACGIKGNNVELVKQVLGSDKYRAFKWLEKEFNAGGNIDLCIQEKSFQATKQGLFVDKIQVERSKAGLNQSNFSLELMSFGIPEEHLLKWNVGRGKRNRTLFFYQDINGRFCNVKSIVYKAGLRRDKEIPPSYLFKKSDGYKTCLFGENQLKNRTKGFQVLLVESEKTAIIGSYVMPDKIWIATGGSNGLTAEKAEVLKGGNVFIFFDADTPGRKAAHKANKILGELKTTSKIIDLFKNKNNGYDVADYLIDKFVKLKKNINGLPETVRERFEERAGILEYEAGFNKFEAEERALNEVLKGE